jgi:pimeloyl-ACP methyl ester carboxylesterase
VIEPVSLWTDRPPRLHLAAWDGDGPPLLLLHGMGAHTHWWDACASTLMDRTRPVALDLRGHGDSDWRPDGDYTAANWVADIEEARHVMGWERFSLCGHSLGARIALEYAAAHPDRLSSLVAVDFLPEFGGGRFSRARSHAQPFYATKDEALKRFRLQPDGTILDDAALAALADLSIRKTEQGWTWKYDWRAFRYQYTPIWDLLPRVKTRALVVRGAESKLMPQAALDRVVAGLSDARAVDVPAAHHHVPLDAPEALAAAISAFVAP